MIKLQYLRFAISATILFFLSALNVCWAATSITRTDADTILFLIPDSYALSSTNTSYDPKIQVWLDAAKEEGLHVQVITDTAFVQLGSQSTQYLGLIMPDQVHINASDTIISSVQNYVSNGGNLMLVYDAGVLTSDGFYAPGQSRFSTLVGVNYALYDQLLGSTIGSGNLTALQSTWRKLGVPPGKSMLYPTAPASTDPVQGLTSYYYGFLNYPSFVTQGTYSGSAFITSPNFGLVAGLNTYNKGQVLFINTPLGYLAGYGTDGLLLHGFLHYFGVGLLQLPYQSALPSGTSGMVINIHTDCGNSNTDIQTMDNSKIWNNGSFWNAGPFSIDFTAGPDCVNWGDAKGLNVAGNTTTQYWIKYFLKKGHEVGSHGGWIHDYFGLNVSETNADTIIAGTSYTFKDLLALNKSTVENVTGRSSREYAAPEGNTPKWSVAWLEQNGVVGYYWVGDTGMAPTRGYREGQLFTKKIWTFPITPYETSATFEEFSANNINASEASTWLTDLVDFSVQQRTSRMIYFHEPGATGRATGVSYMSALQGMLNRAAQYTTSRFKWYTMTQLADFLSSREQTGWQVSLLSNGKLQVDASAPSGTTPASTLSQLTWVFPQSRYGQPVAISNVTVKNDSNAKQWLVIANSNAMSAQFQVPQLSTPVIH